MYSHGFDKGIESDGVLKEMERRYEERLSSPPPPPEENVAALAKTEDKGIKKLFSHIDMEDLLIIAIALLILLDGEPDNNIIAIALIFLLLF